MGAVPPTPNLPTPISDLTPTPTPSALSAELKEVLAFTESENNKHRAFFESLYKWTAGALTILVVFVGGIVAFVGWHTISDIRKQAQEATASEVRATKEQSEKVMAEETIRIQQQVSNRLNAEFQTDSIRRTIGEAARSQTSSAMMPIINKEVKTQVTSGVHAEQSSIQAALVNQTKQALDDMKPVIDRTVESRVKGAVDQAVRTQVDAQISPRIQQLQNSEQLSQLIGQAQSGDGNSYDILRRIVQDPTQDPNYRVMAERTLSALLVSHNGPFTGGLGFKTSVTPEEKLAKLKSPNPLERRVAIDSITGDYARTHLDDLFNYMMSDSDLGVRESAYRQFKVITKADFLNLDEPTARDWWSKHRPEFVSAPTVNK